VDLSESQGWSSRRETDLNQLFLSGFKPFISQPPQKVADDCSLKILKYIVGME